MRIISVETCFQLSLLRFAPIPIELCRIIFLYLREPIGDHNIKSAVSLWDVYCVEKNPASKHAKVLFRFGPLSTWDVSNVTRMDKLFLHCSILWRRNVTSEDDITLWDVSNVRTMHAMFKHQRFNQPIGNWNVGKVINMEEMFQNVQGFNQPLNDWDVSNVEYMSSMFLNCLGFNQPLDRWNIHKVRDFRFFLGFYEICGTRIIPSKSFRQSLKAWKTKKANAKKLIIGWEYITPFM